MRRYIYYVIPTRDSRFLRILLQTQLNATDFNYISHAYREKVNFFFFSKRVCAKKF